VALNNDDEELIELAAQVKVRLPERKIDQATIAETLKRRLPRHKTAGKKAEKILHRIMDEERGRY